MTARTKKRTAGRCRSEGCTRAVTDYAGLGLCNACYHFEWRWSQRTPADRHRREQELEFHQSRLQRIRGPRLRVVRGGKR